MAGNGSDPPVRLDSGRIGLGLMPDAITIPISLDQDLVDLQKSYGFPANDSVVKFLANHRAVSSALLAAAPRLKEYFGHDSILNLEVSTDEDESQTLYAVTIWHENAHTAAEALDRFEENWWLDHMTPNTTDLAFTYKLA